MSNKFSTVRNQRIEAFERDLENLFQQQLGDLAQVVMASFDAGAVRPGAPVESPRWSEPDQVIAGEYKVVTPKPATESLRRKVTLIVVTGWGLRRRNLYTGIWLLLASSSLYLSEPWSALVFCGLALWSLRYFINLWAVAWLLLASGSLYFYQSWLAISFSVLGLWSLRQRIQAAWTFLISKQGWSQWKP